MRAKVEWLRKRYAALKPLPSFADMEYTEDFDTIKEWVPLCVERFDRRGTEPFELFRSEVGQNSFKIQEFSLENSNISEIFNIKFL